MSVVWTTAIANTVRTVPVNERLGWDIDDAEWQAEWSVGRDNWEGRRTTLERSGWAGVALAWNRVLVGESRPTAQLMRDLRRQYAEDTGIANRHYSNNNGEQRMCGVAGWLAGSIHYCEMNETRWTK
jgi:hypothetical protein